MRRRLGGDPVYVRYVHPRPLLETLLPEEFSARLRKAEETTAQIRGGVEVNVAVSYGGRQEIADAAKTVVTEYAAARRLRR